MTPTSSTVPPEGTRLLARWIRLVCRGRIAVLLLLVAAGAAAALYTARNFRIDTDRDRMLADDLPFRVDHQRLLDAFPQLRDTAVLVVDAPYPEAARAVVGRLGERLAAEEGLFTDVHLPRADPFLEAHAPFYLGLDELEDLRDRLTEIQPFLGRLTRDPNLRGLLSMLEAALREKREGAEVELDRLLDEVGRAAGAVAAGDDHVVSWQELMRDEEPGPDDNRQFAVVQVRMDYGRLFPAGPAMDLLRELARELSQDGARVRITGSVPLAHEELESVMRGGGRIALLITLAVTLSLLWGLRSLRLVVATLVTVALGLFLTAAFALATVGHFNLISVAFAALYFGLGVDYAIHLAARLQELRGEGRDLDAALEGAVLDVGPSLVLCALTTAIGFFAFVPTAYAGVSELGLISGTGMFISLFVSLTVLPAWIRLFPPSARELPPPPAFLSFPERHRTAIVRGAAVLGVAGLASLLAIRFDANPLNLRDEESESVRTFRELLETSETPPWSMQVLRESDSAAREVARRLEALPEVELVVGLDDFVPEEQDEKLFLLEDLALVMGPEIGEVADVPALHASERREALAGLAQELASTVEAYADAPRAAGAPDAAALARAQRGVTALLDAAEAASGGERLASFEAGLLATLPTNLERIGSWLVAQEFGRSDLPADQAARWVNDAGLRRLEVFPRDDLDDQGAMRRFAEAVTSVAPGATGAPLTIVASGDAVAGAFRQALGVAVTAIALVLLLLLREVRGVLLVLLPLLFAGVLTSASLVVASIPFNFANVIGLPLLLGIGVDSSIHMLHRARAMRPGEVGLLRTAAARAVVCSALTTFASFVALSLSAHPGTASMGQLLSIGIVWTLVAALVLLPALAMGGAARER